MAGALGRISRARAAEHLDVVSDYGLPTALPAEVSADALIALMRLGKKATDESTFVLDGPSGAELVPGVPEQVVAATLAAIPPDDQHARSVDGRGSRPCPNCC
ncbi:hypothetical protein [Streptomyces sp. B8F3]|uniref:hypothetical protein n=1 Tax=unclassified Streptomyces TaxID=2593676 RepID=UPI00325F17E8